MIGCISPIFWGLSVSLVRTLSETLGVGKGLAINYLIALVFVFLLFGIPNLKAMPLKYYICGLGCAIGTSMTFAFSLGLAKDGTQTMEVGMINYLWPTLTILFAVLFTILSVSDKYQKKGEKIKLSEIQSRSFYLCISQLQQTQVHRLQK